VSILLQNVYGKSPSMVHRAIAGETILVPIRRDVAELDDIYSLDGIGPRVWELVDGQRTVEDIVDSIVQEYEVDRVTAEGDVLAFLSQLESLGALERVS
jgi:hypothetical protein